MGHPEAPVPVVAVVLREDLQEAMQWPDHLLPAAALHPVDPAALVDTE